MTTATPHDSPSALPHGPMGAVRIGVFDSGVGGLSVLRSLHSLMPTAELTYVADSGYAPYGERSDAFVVDRSRRIASHLIEQARSQLLVVACNTATAAAVHSLRESWPNLPIVGVEPGLKPAVVASPMKKVGVLATPSTLRSGKFHRLLDQYGPGVQVILQPCPGLAAEIERADLEAPALVSTIEGFCAPLRSAGVDVVVLGCTHYAFVRHHIERAMGADVTIIDTADAVARHAVRLASNVVADEADTADSPSTVKLYTTGDAELLDRVVKSWLPFECSIARCNP